MLLLAGLYFLSALAVLLFTTELLYVVNLAPVVLKFAEPIPIVSDRLWTAMAASWLFLLGMLAIAAFRAPAVRTYLWLQALSLTLSGAVLLAFFFQDKPYFAYFFFGVLHVVMAGYVSWRALRYPDAAAPEATAITTETTKEIAL